ncbi:Papain family cysteine protease [Phytophthora infestans]|uniref:Papain family cysteine protease n=1 Tax=Phytophthora infestans TaxID=4787 RepID=A0A8S9UM84_PHYIN|nr:Papain family cysteine protease [Phytophthora infestans]
MQPRVSTATVALAVACVTLSDKVEARPMHAEIVPKYHRYLAERETIKEELNEWLKIYDHNGPKNGFIPVTESRSSDDDLENKLQRFYITKEQIEEARALNPMAEFSTDGPFTLMTMDEFKQFLSNSHLNETDKTDPPPVEKPKTLSEKEKTTSKNKDDDKKQSKRNDKHDDDEKKTGAPATEGPVVVPMVRRLHNAGKSQYSYNGGDYSNKGEGFQSTADTYVKSSQETYQVQSTPQTYQANPASDTNNGGNMNQGWSFKDVSTGDSANVAVVSGGTGSNNNGNWWGTNGWGTYTWVGNSGNNGNNWWNSGGQPTGSPNNQWTPPPNNQWTPPPNNQWTPPPNNQWTPPPNNQWTPPSANNPPAPAPPAPAPPAPPAPAPPAPPAPAPPAPVPSAPPAPAPPAPPAPAPPAPPAPAPPAPPAPAPPAPPSTTPAPATKRPATKRPATKAPPTKAPATKDPATKAPAPAPAAPKTKQKETTTKSTTDSDTARDSDPDSVDWSKTKCVNPPGLQGQCGSCWAFASLGALEAAQCIANGQKNVPAYSEQQLVSCDTKDFGCNGGAPVYAMQYLRDNGVCTDSSYPYTSVEGGTAAACVKTCTPVKSGITDIVRLKAGDESALLGAVKKQPVVVSVISNNPAWKQYRSGVITSCNVATIDHAVLAVGYDATTIKIKNSWGTDWGEDGYVRISRSPQGMGTCAVLTDMSYPKV